MKNTLLLYLKFQYTTYRLLSENQNLLFLDVILAIVTAFLFFCIFFRVKSRLLCKMLYNVFTVSTYQN
ncbi:hypothetical protein FVD73_12515 [Enterococcus faecium]|nr:hypothetical protein [Enterococcus faecium]MCZ1345466.1 hypothetical protein [Enterococcus faecium]